MSIEQLFYELLQVAISNRRELSCIPTKYEWQELFNMSKKQSLVGISFYAVRKLKETNPDDDGFGSSIGIPEAIYLKWMGMMIKTVQRNKNCLQVCKTLTEEYEAEGLSACVMKGQANRRYYPSDLAELRTSGDIDLWLTNWTNHTVRDVMELHRRRDDVVSLCYLHIENKKVKGVPLEVHFRPSFMNAPLANRRFLKLFGRDAVEYDDELGFDVLKVEKDVVFQMNHIYRHLLDEGVGLRQVLDYWLLLTFYFNKLSTTYKGGNVINEQKEMIVRDIERVGMKRFAGALMWVMALVFDPRNENENWASCWPWMLCAPDEKEGRFLLDEIMLSGNFGKYDPRMQKLEVNKGKVSYQVQRALRRMKRNLHFIGSYPSEVICEPFARVAHLIWRKLELWRY